MLAVYTGASVSALTQVAASNGGTGSTVTFQAQAGTTYRIAVDGSNGATGIYALNGKYTATNLAIAMTAAEATPTSIKYGITVNNAGPGIATNTKVTVNLPAGVSLDTTQAGGCTAVGNVVTCLPGAINPISSASVTFYATASVAGNYSTTGSVSSDLANLNTTNNSVTVVTPFDYNDLSISLYTAEVATTSIMYNIVATNAGPRIATNAKATVTLPSGVTLDPAKTGGCTAVGNVVTCLLGTINVLGSASATFYAIVPVLGTYTATASVSSDIVDMSVSGVVHNSTSTPITVVTYVPPAVNDSDVPTLPEWGMMLFGCLLFGTTIVQNRINKGRRYTK